MSDPRATGTYADLVGWIEFAATYAIDLMAPSDVAAALREVAVQVDQFPDECWQHDPVENKDFIGPIKTVRDDA